MANVGSRAYQNARLQKKLKNLAETFLPAVQAAYRQGRQAEVQALCRRVLQEVPNYFDAMHLLGASLLDCGQLEEARQALAGAVALEPGSADAQYNLGFALFNLQRYEEACACQERAVALKPDFAKAHANLGTALLRLERAGQAVAAFTRAIALKPYDADAYCNRGVAQLMLKQYAAAADSFERALAFQPRHFEALVNKGLAHVELRHFAVAEAAYNAALAIKPDVAELHAHRGRMHLLLGRRSEAKADFDRAAALDPTLELAWRGKAQVAMLTQAMAEAMLACKKVLDLNPTSEFGLTLLGICLGQQGDIAAAIQHFDRALEIKPDCEEAIVQKIFRLDFLPDADFAVQQAARRRWWDAIGSKMQRRTLAARPRDPDRRIVVGYVSSDFRRHSAAFAFLPVLRSHDRAQFQINCYSCSTTRDGLTEVFQSLADVWVDAFNLSDDELTDRIASDRVDILVDLSGFTSGHRLAIFARKPAPIQVSAWGHPTGTGLPTMDYVLADPVSIPSSVRHLFAEQIHDLPCMITMDAIEGAHATELPMLRNGYVTFGVFNRIEKISDAAIVVWAKLMQELPDARIVIKNTALDDAYLRDGLIGRFVDHGIAAERITCMGS
ncbi:tetratricopeptide repeat protein, partial [Bradyrhizobium sp. STM 3843]|uniref:O-linked N-acetylglucosamine transferase, SPINDLY family protein n=1 Tax=Bradyrhizobium sp. STM 3843 TaxID=551947 RepID=UPI00055EDE19